MSEFIVEKGIKMPKAATGANGYKYPFGKMKIGDSFVASKSNRSKIASAAITYGKNHKIKFSVRAEGDLNIRIWRIA